MPISNSCIQANANALIGAATTRQLAQVSGLLTENSTYSVACIAALPSASDNQGRLIYVTDIGAYRYSDGSEWTNCYDTTCRIARTEIYGWGQNTAIGDNRNDGVIKYSSPIQETSLSGNWCTLSTSGNVTHAVKTDGTLWGWGRNTTRNIGDNTSTNRSSPVQEITSSTDWCEAHVGKTYTIGLKTDGTLWNWGKQCFNVVLNIGGSTSVMSPVQETLSETTWSKVSAGYHASAIKTNGTHWAWGRNSGGQTGNGISGTDYNCPVQEITSSTDWCDTVAGQGSTIAIKTGGTLWGWGCNVCGILGHGDVINYSSPVQEVTSSTNWQTTCGSGLGFFAFASIKTDGTLWALGHRSRFLDSLYHSSPIQETSSSTNWCTATPHREGHSAIKTDGTLWGSGWDLYGKLGLNKSDNTTYSGSFIQEFTSTTTWCCVSGVYETVTALKYTETGFNEP